MSIPKFKKQLMSQESKLKPPDINKMLMPSNNYGLKKDGITLKEIIPLKKLPHYKEQLKLIILPMSLPENYILC